jgi:uncharacterized DUF497 family protein
MAISPSATTVSPIAAGCSRLQRLRERLQRVNARLQRAKCGLQAGVGVGSTVFRGVTIEIGDTRRDYGERRIFCYGLLAGRMVVVGYTPRGRSRHVFSMRKANGREQSRLAKFFEVESGEG